MAKKTKKVVPTKEDLQRKALIKEYNKNNTDTQILERKVREEDVTELEAELKAMQDRQANMTYLVADVNNAERVYEFLKDWNANHFLWTRDMWKGVIKFDEFLTDWYTKYQAEKQDLVFDFAAMSYSYNMLMNPAGCGLKDAQFMSSVDEQYNAVLDVLGKYVDEFQEDNRKFKLLQDCLAARYQGLMMVVASPDDTTPVEENNDIVEESCDTVDDNK